MNQAVLSPDSSRARQTFARDQTLQARYRIIRQLGAGGMGAVYEAVDERLQATVAIKETFAVDDRLRRQFEQEARLLAQLHHPALPRVSDYFTENGRAFLVMQFIAGDDLAQIISRQPGPFPRAQVIAWADQLLDALIYLHTRERQITHRDIKPHNLKLTSTGQIALLDFGLAKTHAADQSTTQSSHSIFGYTRRYSPLEQIQDQGTSPQSDIYALGATLYHLLTGIKPPDALARAAALANSKTDPLSGVKEAQSIIGPELSAVLSKAMALNAVDRYANASEFREALRRVGRRNFEPALSQFSMKTATSTAANRAATTDPFDGYSILKPEQDLFRPGKTRHAPAVFVAVLALGLITIAVAYPNQVINSASAVLSSVNSTNPRVVSNGRVLSDATALRQPKSEATPTKPNLARNSSASTSGEMKRVDSQKRHGASSRTIKPPGIKPPPYSIAP